jgi:hypothetical protein
MLSGLDQNELNQSVGPILGIFLAEPEMTNFGLNQSETSLEPI